VEPRTLELAAILHVWKAVEVAGVVPALVEAAPLHIYAAAAQWGGAARGTPEVQAGVEDGVSAAGGAGAVGGAVGVAAGDADAVASAAAAGAVGAAAGAVGDVAGGVAADVAAYAAAYAAVGVAADVAARAAADVAGHAAADVVDAADVAARAACGVSPLMGVVDGTLPLRHHPNLRRPELVWEVVGAPLPRVPVVSAGRCSPLHSHKGCSHNCNRLP